MEIFFTASARETREIGVRFAKKTLRGVTGKHAMVLGLKGDLGAGKTTFVQGFAKGLGIKDSVLSPTFIIVKKFAIGGDSAFRHFYHIDCYRLGGPEEISALGFREIVLNPHNIAAIEWPERIAGILPSSAKEIIFIHLKENEREIKIT